MSEPVFVEVGTRMYELVLIPGAIERENGHTLCHVDHPAQQVMLSDQVPESERAGVAAKAVSLAWKTCGRPFRQIPVIGPVE